MYAPGCQSIECTPPGEQLATISAVEVASARVDGGIQTLLFDEAAFEWCLMMAQMLGHAHACRNSETSTHVGSVFEIR